MLRDCFAFEAPYEHNSFDIVFSSSNGKIRLSLRF
jgi:hypothetical protein